MTNVGTEGLLWSSSSYAAGNYNAGFLNFNSGNVRPLNNGNRAAALSVRCVQHLRRELFFSLSRGVRGVFAVLPDALWGEIVGSFEIFVIFAVETPVSEPRFGASGLRPFVSESRGSGPAKSPELTMILTIYTATTMIVLAYLLGSIPSAVWIGKKYYGIDIREHGSKNAGTTNMLRVLGRRAALPVFALDFLKGFVAVTVVELMQYDDLIGQNDIINLKIGAVVAAVLGHIFPVFAGFRGGKGVATLVGAVTGIYPPAAMLCFGVWIVVLMISHYVSLSSMIAGCCFPVFTLISPKVNGSVPFVVFSFVIAVLLIVTHRKNIKRLKEGTESKIYIWRPRRVRVEERKADKRS